MVEVGEPGPVVGRPNTTGRVVFGFAVTQQVIFTPAEVYLEIQVEFHFFRVTLFAFPGKWRTANAAE